MFAIEKEIYEKYCKTNELSIKKVESRKLKKHEDLKAKIKVSKHDIQELREYIRSMTFENVKEEITFFKSIKPKICGELNFFRRQLEYIQEKPNISIGGQKDYIKKELRKLQLKKKKNLSFYRYTKQEETAFDEIYFVRGKEQLELFSFSEFLDTDIRFTTSHDLLACEVVTYDLLTQFYKQELHCLANIEVDCLNTSKNNNISWSGSKSDLIEIIYAFQSLGVLNNGNIDIKEIAIYFEQVFNISLGDYYRSFQDIRARKINQTKFIDKLKDSFVQRLQNIDE